MANPKFLMTHLIYLLMRRLEERPFVTFIISHSNVGAETQIAFAYAPNVNIMSLKKVSNVKVCFINIKGNIKYLHRQHLESTKTLFSHQKAIYVRDLRLAKLI